MKRAKPEMMVVLLLTLGLSGCELVGELLQAGFWAGVILVLLVVAGVVFLVRRLRGPRGGADGV